MSFLKSFIHILDGVFFKGNTCKFLISVFLFTQALSADFWPLYTEDCQGWREDGGQTNILGPLLESGYNEKESWTAIRPIAGRYYDNDCNESENYFLYPLLSNQTSPYISNFNILNLLKGRKEFNRDGKLLSRRLTLFPIFMNHYDGIEGTNCMSIFPLFGNVRNFFGQDRIKWTLFPLSLSLTKCKVTTHHLFWPFIRWQDGPGAGGGGIWPLYTRYYVDGKYDKTFVLWPLIYYERICIPDVGVETRHAFLPFYEYRSSPNLEVRRFIWPFFAHIKQKEPCYEETQYLWPLFVQGRGETTYVNRWAPFYTRSIRRDVDRRWIMWPVLNIRQWVHDDIHIKQERFLYFLFTKQTQRSCSNPELAPAFKTSLWPLFSYWDNGAGRKQLQILSPFEPLFPNNKGIKRMYNPIFGIFRASVEDCTAKQSFLWDLIAAEKSPSHQKFSIGPIVSLESSSDGDKTFELLKGFFGYKKHCGKTKVRFLWITF